MRRVHQLTEPQQQALADLIALGARLDAAFTEGELRSAFRSLARRFHPDRHPGGTSADQTHHARQFARVADSYRCLLTVRLR